MLLQKGRGYELLYDAVFGKNSLSGENPIVALSIINFGRYLSFVAGHDYRYTTLALKKF